LKELMMAAVGSAAYDLLVRRIALFFVLALAAFSPATTGQHQTQAPDVKFEIVPTKSVFQPGDEISVRLILTNRGEAPVRVERFSAVCSSDLFAFVDLKILDSRNRGVRKAGCAADTFPTEERVAKIASEIDKSDHWIELKQGDLYGRVESFAITRGRGKHTIQAEFVPARLGDDNFKALEARKIIVLQHRIAAQRIAVTVR
jgi:hypothetical protein